jgi:hypothetical protein
VISRENNLVRGFFVIIHIVPSIFVLFDMAVRWELKEVTNAPLARIGHVAGHGIVSGRPGVVICTGATADSTLDDVWFLADGMRFFW